MDEQTTSITLWIRQAFRDLFGSRLVNTLETLNMQLRNDFEQRLIERDEVIASLRADLAAARSKIEQYELVIIPLTSPAANLLNPKPKPTFEPFTEKSSWVALQERWYAEQDRLAAEEAQNGVRSEINGEKVQQ